MSEISDQVKMARNLRTIEELHSHLEDQAIHKFDDKDMPGGAAMVMLGPSANLEAWNYRVLSAVMGRTNDSAGVDDLESDPAPPLLVLAGWVDMIREELDQPTDLRATIGREVAYLRKQLDWLHGEDEYGEPNYLPVQELGIDLHKLRIQMENVLMEGIRYERTETPCDKENCDGSSYLVKLYGASVVFDFYHCMSCDTDYTLEEYVNTRKLHMFSVRADEAWIDVNSAAKSIGRSSWTIRCWMKPRERDGKPYEEARVRSRKTGPMERIEVRWADVRDQDAEAKRRLEWKRHAS